MKTIIEEDSPVPALLLLGGIFLLFIGGGLGLAYVGGVFIGKNEVAKNDQRIANQASHISSPSPVPAPVKP
jgi:hypothetical protein